MRTKDKPEILPTLNWQVKKKHNGPKGNLDVGITVIKATKDYNKRVSFTFRDEIWRLFNCDYVNFAVLKNRIYFKGTDKAHGFKLSHNNEASKNAYTKLTLSRSEAKSFEQFIGDYELKFDDFYNLYYIQKD